MTEHFSRREFLKAFGVASAAAGAPGFLFGARAYQPTWESLARHSVPAWFADGKFGIFFHWSLYSVPAFDSEWYSRNMYIEGSRANNFHNLVYGPPSKFGYKDFIPTFRAEKFNPDEWAELFCKAGARFAGPVTEHADGFSLWDSKVNEWNAAHMGPCRDVVGEMSRALRNQGLKFLATFHHQWLWGWYPTVDPSVDASKPAYAGLYGPPAPGSPFDFDNYPGHPLPPPTADFQETWQAKVTEVIDKYRPDHIYFDSRLEIIDAARLKTLIATYYNEEDEWRKEVGLSYKLEALPPGVGILDVESGRLADISPRPWLTDDDIDWSSWCYVQNPRYKSAGRIVGQLVDVVSKNGTLLLDVNPTANGVMPEPTVERLLAIGKWLEVNGEAIYGTRPWKVLGEGPTENKAGTFGESSIPEFTAEDVRFTSRGRTVYAILMGWPQTGREFAIKLLGTERGLLASGEIKNVVLLGSDEKLVWRQRPAGLSIGNPQHKPGDYAYAFRIELA